MEKGKCVVILSGGIDSSTVAYWAKREGYEVHAITFNYGQRAAREIESARKIAKKLNAPIKVVNVSSLKEIFAGVTSLCDKSIPVSAGFDHSLIVPFRNAIFLSIAVAYALSVGATHIFYGAQASDRPFYPDCREEFYKSFEQAAKLGTEREIYIEAPFRNILKSEIIKIGNELGVPFSLTWSCYLEGEKHCGRCESCINRRRAFEEAGVPDPTVYAV
ncbi:MAG: 7-cyano-7-deazaguanine synthase QueC [Nitrososphaerota archaeon]|nr:7-cyano-7-deazaguanine synthase QueC [Candidatus Bathyarchaeota archaeon]MDW8048224.1 7-cyano-7-deazaguanine synthase QueC [Nitrososphaerota archaeon]